MKNIKPKFKIVGIIAVVFIILAITLIYALQKNKTTTSIPIAITDSTPKDGASGVSVFDPITITFNQKVDSSTFTVSSDPSENWTISQTTPSTIKLDHQLYLEVSTTYKLTVLQNDNVVGTITFETENEQNDPRQLQNLQSELNKDYPLASLTPYETSNFRVVYTAPLTLGITLKGSTEAQDAILQVESWVESNGIDPGTHKYIIIAASPTP
ncbi:MAG: Ig-like domain-containing protein [Candidatus Microgenomates bacterium]|jgi:hypothetical protein